MMDIQTINNIVAWLDGRIEGNAEMENESRTKKDKANFKAARRELITIKYHLEHLVKTKEDRLKRLGE